MPSLKWYQRATLFMARSVKGKKLLKKISYKFFVINSIAKLRSSYFNFLRSFQIILFLTIFTQMPCLNRHEKVTRFMEFSANGKKSIENFFTHKLFVIIWIAMLRSSYCNFLRSFQILLFLTNYIQMTSLNRHERVTRFMEFSVNGKKQPKNLSYRILVIISFGLLRSSYFNFLGSFQILLLLTNFILLTSLKNTRKLSFHESFGKWLKIT